MTANTSLALPLLENYHAKLLEEYRESKSPEQANPALILEIGNVELALVSLGRPMDSLETAATRELARLIHNQDKIPDIATTCSCSLVLSWYVKLAKTLSAQELEHFMPIYKSGRRPVANSLTIGNLLADLLARPDLVLTRPAADALHRFLIPFLSDVNHRARLVEVMSQTQYLAHDSPLALYLYKDVEHGLGSSHAHAMALAHRPQVPYAVRQKLHAYLLRLHPTSGAARWLSEQLWAAPDLEPDLRLDIYAYGALNISLPKFLNSLDHFGLSPSYLLLKNILTSKISQGELREQKASELPSNNLVLVAYLWALLEVPAPPQTLLKQLVSRLSIPFPKEILSLLLSSDNKGIRENAIVFSQLVQSAQKNLTKPRLPARV